MIWRIWQSGRATLAEIDTWPISDIARANLLLDLEAAAAQAAQQEAQRGRRTR